MALAMVFFSVLCILFGVAPELLYRFLPYPVDYQAYTAGKVVFYLQLLLFSGLAFFLLLPLMKRTETISLDADWLWRVALRRLANGLLVLGGRIGQSASAAFNALLGRLGSRARRLFGGAPDDDDSMPGVFARAWPIGTTALWIAVLLTAYVFFYYLA
jgi:multicomponent Na+:H+ antiporter subunit D